jgi:glutamate racemase
LKNTIAKVMGDGVKLVSSAQEVARVVKSAIIVNNIQRDPGYSPEYSYYTSDSVEKFEPLCSTILGVTVNSAEKVDIEKY